MSNRQEITNFEIKIKIAEMKKISRCFPFESNQINMIINIHQLMKKQQIKYNFVISNSDRSDQPGMHWLGLLENHPKNAEFFFILLEYWN